MKRADGREVLAQLALPLPLEFAGRLMGAVCEAAEGSLALHGHSRYDCPAHRRA